MLAKAQAKAAEKVLAVAVVRDGTKVGQKVLVAIVFALHVGTKALISKEQNAPAQSALIVGKHQSGKNCSKTNLLNKLYEDISRLLALYDATSAECRTGSY
eukprot:TRINITY_DN41840_c0_g1_i1.p2 TRINITY_DN41840_c0_g1~~TRINITY_DN41840_c0_g1_i1.p2  ORF type:complete len:101 (-),score=13.83 TRINITY_DN41840_c0_g1_i1:68-370(-)